MHSDGRSQAVANRPIADCSEASNHAFTKTRQRLRNPRRFKDLLYTFNLPICTQFLEMGMARDLPPGIQLPRSLDYWSSGSA